MILFTGGGTSGSWQVRGVQLGQACGAVVKPKATLGDCTKADLIVVVKRMSLELRETIRRSKTPWVWDVVDFYPQPLCTQWSGKVAIAWVRSQLKKNAPNGVIWPNVRMGNDCKTRIPSTTVYHHHRPDIQINPIRDQIKTIGYEGSPRYLGDWKNVLALECYKRGWNLKLNEGVHADFDLCVAFRASPFNGYAQQHWKSNVKLANCHGSGTPFIGPIESAYLETKTGAELWIDNPHDIGRVFDQLESVAIRKEIKDTFLKKAYSVQQAADDLMAFVRGM